MVSVSPSAGAEEWLTRRGRSWLMSPDHVSHLRQGHMELPSLLGGVPRPQSRDLWATSSAPTQCSIRSLQFGPPPLAQTLEYIVEQRRGEHDEVKGVEMFFLLSIIVGSLSAWGLAAASFSPGSPTKVPSQVKGATGTRPSQRHGIFVVSLCNLIRARGG